jgi:heme exporter protein A
MTFDQVTVQSVSKIYGRQRALAGATLRLQSGRLCLLLGENGAGKSTLLAILSTLVRPTSGEVRFGDLAHAAAAHKLRGQIALVAHDPLLYFDLSARENLRFFAKVYGCADRGDELLARVALQDAAANRPARTYSRGMLQRLALARALLPRPRLLLLDEPFVGLDQSGIAMLRALLLEVHAEGTIVLLATHDLAAAAGLASQVVVLRRGRVAVDQSSAQPFQRVDDLYGAAAGAVS